MPSNRPATAPCAVCGSAFAVPVRPGPPPETCSTTCRTSHRNTLRRDRRRKLREARLDALVTARALDLLRRSALTLSTSA